MTTVTPPRSARRRLFPTPASSVKRRRVMTQTRIPRSLQPEIKQFVNAITMGTVGANTATLSIPIYMNQGNDGDEFLGSKFRILRVRVFFDYTDVTTTSGIRMALGIPKDPSATTVLTNASDGTVVPHNMRQVTMLKEMFLKTDGSNLNGYMEWLGPLNVEMNDTGNTPLKNNLILQVNSIGVGALLAATARTRVEVLFTG